MEYFIREVSTSRRSADENSLCMDRFVQNELRQLLHTHEKYFRI